MWERKKVNEKLAEMDNFTVLGKDVTFKGVVQFEGTVQLESYFEGEIYTKGLLVVGEHAVIRGTITVGTLISSGKIQGNVTATNKVQLLKTAVQIGDVQSPILSIEEGAYFKGFADMGASPWTDESPQSDDPLLGLTIRQKESEPLLVEHDPGS